MPQTILPFKLETTDKELTTHGGLAMIGEFRHAMNVPRQLNAGLRAVLRLPVVPSANATGDWLRRIGEQDGLARLAVVNHQQIRRALKRESLTDYTLDPDATQIGAAKQAAK